MKENSVNKRPTVEEIEAELRRLEKSKSRGQMVGICLSTLVLVAAIAVLAATLWLPVLQVTGSSMAPVLNEGDIVAVEKNGSFGRGDLIAFYHNERILIKRVVGMPGDAVEIDASGNVCINGERISETWISAEFSGAGDTEYPLIVPANYYFVLGDNSSVSLDSRYSELGPISGGRIIGKVIFRLWPVSGLGNLK